MTRHRPERGSSKTLVAVSIDPVSSSMKLPAARDGNEEREDKERRIRNGEGETKNQLCMCVYIWIEPDGKWMEGGGINYCHSRIPMVCLVANTAIRHRTRPTSYPTSSWPCSTPTVPVGRNATTTASIHLPPPPPPPH